MNLYDPYASEKTNQIFMLLAVFSFILQIKNLFLLKVVQPVGYIVDLYSMFPLSFYLALISCYFIATLLVLNGKNALGTLILSINHFEILIIPYMLKYYSMGRADDMSYIGEYLQIANSGYFSGWDIYPASHIIGASISLVSNFDAHYTSFIIPIAFSFIFIAGIYLFSRELFLDHCIRSLVLVSSFILYLGVYNFLNVPHALFFSFMPLYLCYFYRYFMKHNDISHSIILVLMTSIIPFAHPFIVFLLLVVFLFHLIPGILTASSMEFLRIPRAKMFSFFLLVISFFSWLFYNEFLSLSFRRSYLSFIKKISEPVFLEVAEEFGKINFGFFDYAQLLILYYGRYSIPTFIVLISAIYLYYHKNLLKTETLKNYPYLLLFYIVLLCIQLLLVFNPIITHQVDRIANLNFVVYAQVPLFACSLYLLFFNQSKSVNKMIFVCLTLSFVWSLSLFGCFDSPNVYRPNVALTYNEVYGMDWFYGVKCESSIVAVPLSQINRFHDLFGNFDADDPQYMFPDHFGYKNNSHSTLVDINSDLYKNSYIIILTIDELLYQKISAYRTVGRYYKEDFDRFRKDISVNKIYDSLNIGIYNV